MGMFLKNSRDAHPKFKGNEEHIMPQSLRPIRNSHARLLARDNRAQANEAERARGGKHRQTMQPRVVFFGSHLERKRAGIVVGNPGNADVTPFARENSTGPRLAQVLCELFHKGMCLAENAKNGGF